MGKVYPRHENLHAKGNKVAIQIDTSKFEWYYVGCFDGKYRYVAHGIQIDLDEDTSEAVFGWAGEVN